MTRAAKFWKSWLDGPLCSADSLGRIVASMHSDTLRQGIHRVYDRLKRNEALPDLHGLAVAVLDGHETSASYHRCCSGCLKRTTGSGEMQFYHRNVTLMLLCGAPPDRPAVRLLLDLEPLQPGEAELAPALRLLERVLAAYPRAFDWFWPTPITRSPTRLGVANDLVGSASANRAGGALGAPALGH